MLFIYIKIGPEPYVNFITVENAISGLNIRARIPSTSLIIPSHAMQFSNAVFHPLKKDEV